MELSFANMQGRVMRWFKTIRQVPALALLFAILAPVLLGILPSAAMSAEQQLSYDTSQNICTNLPSDHDKKQHQGDHNQCCILCNTQNHALLQEPVSTPVFAPPVAVHPEKTGLAILAIPNAPPDLRATAPRGPPASLLI
jgi:hypothetical protein